MSAESERLAELKRQLGDSQELFDQRALHLVPTWAEELQELRLELLKLGLERQELGPPERLTPVPETPKTEKHYILKKVAEVARGDLARLLQPKP